MSTDNVAGSGASPIDPQPQDPTTPGAAVESTGPSPGVSAPMRDHDLPAAIRASYAVRGQDTTGQSYAKGVRRFIEFVQDKGWTLATMPGTAVEEYLNGRENPITRNVAASSIRVLFDFCGQIGHTFVAQPITRVKVIRTRRAQTADGTQGAGGAPPAPGTLPAPTFSSPQSTVDAAAAAMQPAAPGALAQARATMPVRPRTALPGLGGRVRVSKRTDGSEGLAVPIGSRVLVGTYTADDLTGEDSIASFIANFIRPNYGPFKGGRPTTYVVERLDNVGNPMQGGTYDVPIMPSEDPMPGSAAASAVQPVAPAAPAPVLVPVAAPRPAEEEGRFLDYVLQQNSEANQKYEAAMTELRTQKDKTGMDAATFMLLSERLKPKEVDVEAAARAFRRVNPVEPTPAPAHLGGFEPFGAPPRADPNVEALTSTVKMLADQVTALTVRVATPPAAPAAPAIDPLVTFTNMLAAMKALQPTPLPPDPMLAKLAEITLLRLSAEPKTKTLAETIADMKAIKNFTSGEEGSGSGISWPEVIAGVFENADKIGAAIAQLRGPPVLPARVAPSGPPAAAAPAAPPVKTAPPPLPEVAKKAFLTLRDLPADKDQEIVGALYSILMAIDGAPEPWPGVSKRTIQSFVNADSKPEIRSIITQLFVWCGAKKLLTDELLEKVTTVIHHHYTLIYANLTNGQEKVLTDAPGAPSATASGEQPAAPEGEEPAGEDEGEEEGDDGEEEPEEPAEPTTVTVEAARSAPPGVVTFQQPGRG